jgi:ABC-type transporter Mla subunit MlaD
MYCLLAILGGYTVSTKTSRQNVNENRKKWDHAIQDAQELLSKVENRAARLQGAIRTLTELRDHEQDFDANFTAATR